MHPVLLTFHLAGAELTLGAYATFYALAWAVALALGTVVAARRGVRWWRASLFLLAAGVAGIVGARLLDIATNWGAYAADPSLAYGLEFRGFSLYGGLILAAATGVALARPLRVPLWRVADSAVPALVAGVVLMRTGCFLHGCCFGTVTSLPWGVTFPSGSPAWAYQVATGASGLTGLTGRVLPVHPTQIYEMLAAVVFGGVAVWLGTTAREGARAQRGAAGGTTASPGARTPAGAGRAGPAAGVPFLVFVLGFTLFRVAELYLRPRPPVASGPVWLYPALYAAIILGVSLLLARRIASRRKT